jgi:hypothetical protein
MPAAKKESVFDNAKSASHAAMKSQLDSWGFEEGTAMYKQLLNTASSSLDIYINMDASSQGYGDINTQRHIRPKTIHSPNLLSFILNEKLDTLGFVAKQLRAQLNETPDDSTHTAGEKWKANLTVNATGYDWQHAFVDCLTRVGAGAAIDVIQSYNQSINSQRTVK